MGKHLAPEKKHELNFKNIKPPGIFSRKKPEQAKKSGAAGRVKERAVKPERKLPELGRYPWIFYALAAVLLVGIRFLPLTGWMKPLAYAVPALLTIPEQVTGACEGIRSGDWLNYQLTTCLAFVLTFATGLYQTAVLLMILSYSVCTLEKILEKRCRSVSDSILEILPKEAAVVRASGIERVPPESVVPGDLVLVKAGERIPLDGVITEGLTTINTSLISGQRSPWAVNAGYRVYSGCKNLTSDIHIRVTRTFAQSTACRLARISGSAQDFPSVQESLFARIMKYYTPLMTAAAALTGLVLPFFIGGWADCLQRAAVLLIAARPPVRLFCIPLLYKKSVNALSRIGVFVKGMDCLEALAKTTTIIFDKTGTITEGRFTVTDVYPVKMSEKQLLMVAAAAEAFSRHPIARAIREAAGRLDERLLQSVKSREIPGRGVCTYVGEKKVFAGNAALLMDNGIQYAVPKRPGTAVHVAVDGKYCGHILVTDKVRRRAFDALETMRLGGIKKLVLMTGDVVSATRTVASRLNFDMLRAELKPEDKARAVNYLVNNNGSRSAVAFVGEGENSGKIMTEADVGVAMGSLGSDSAFANADVLIMDRDIFKIPMTLDDSRAVYRAALANGAGCLSVCALTAVCGALGVFAPVTAVILSFLSAVLMLANAWRMK